MQINLINLDRTPGRLAEFNRRNAHLGEVARFTAIDGKRVDLDQLMRRGLLDPRVVPPYTLGAVGCALSHLALWDVAIAEGRALTICEDDAIFNRHFAARTEALLRSLPEGWDMVLWGWNFNSILGFDLLPGVSSCLAQFDQAAMRAGLDKFPDIRLWPGLYPLYRAFGLVCYSVSPKGARLLRGYCFPLRPMDVFFPALEREIPNNGIDIMMNQIYPEMQAYVAFPPLVITANDRDRTTVQIG